MILPPSDDWFPFLPTNDVGPSAIGAEAFLRKAPFGVREHGDRLVDTCGRAVKLWGVNNANENVGTDPATAEKRAARFAKHGVNSVRMHKFTYSRGGGFGDPAESTRLTPEGWARVDALHAALARKGISVGWSPIYGHQPVEGDRTKLKAYDEVRGTFPDSFLRGSTYGLVNIAPDLQDLHIALVVGMLKHRNPGTRRRYADDPALAFVELQNEDDVFFPTTNDALLRSPTYKAELCRDFSAWLVRRYKDDAGLRRAWGDAALDAWPDFQKGESLAARTVFPICHFWWYSREGLANQTVGVLKGNPRRLHDMSAYLHEVQNRFYDRFVRAIRATGYRGAIVASCWQAGDGLSHYQNLRSDARAGLVDRHNYFGGGDSPMRVGTFDARSQLSRPGAGILGTGLQQVEGRPFSVSEWTTVQPNEWVAESPFLFAAYGMGLNGWDASYLFANDEDRYSERVTVRGEGGIWNADLPNNFGLFPLLARMVLRGDVREGPVVRRERVSMRDLERGILPPASGVTQTGDRKEFGGAEALARGRAVVSFGSKTGLKTPEISEGRVQSVTGELDWRYGNGRGWATVDTAGTFGGVGWSEGLPLMAKGGSLTIETPFAAVIVTADGPKENLANARHVLIAAVARVRNTGMVREEGALKVIGAPPLEMEGVRATLRLKRRPLRFEVLDHDGRVTGRTLPVAADGTVALDGARDRAYLYRAVYESGSR